MVWAARCLREIAGVSGRGWPLCGCAPAVGLPAKPRAFLYAYNFFKIGCAEAMALRTFWLLAERGPSMNVPIVPFCNAQDRAGVPAMERA